MKFVTPILQGIIVLLISSLLFGGLKAYGQFESFKTRLETVENNVKALTDKLEAIPLCRSK